MSSSAYSASAFLSPFPRMTMPALLKKWAAIPGSTKSWMVIGPLFFECLMAVDFLFFARSLVRISIFFARAEPAPCLCPLRVDSLVLRAILEIWSKQRERENVLRQGGMENDQGEDSKS